MKKLISFMVALLILTMPVIASASKRTYSGGRNSYKANYTKSYNVSRSTSKVNTNKVNYTTTYIGNRNSHKFHDSSCRYVKRMNESNKVYDKSKSKLTTNGYVPCKVCKP
jgi:hypothetical protein